ncbi:MAG: hypothetical protein ACQER9_03300 [Nanobdellota archaeon]
MAWYPTLGYIIFSIALLAMIIIYLNTRKWYPIAYIISITTYIFTLGFIIDVYQLSKNWIILLLLFTALLMVIIGKYISRKFEK